MLDEDFAQLSDLESLIGKFGLSLLFLELKDQTVWHQHLNNFGYPEIFSAVTTNLTLLLSFLNSYRTDLHKMQRRQLLPWR